MMVRLGREVEELSRGHGLNFLMLHLVLEPGAEISKVTSVFLDECLL